MQALPCANSRQHAPTHLLISRQHSTSAHTGRVRTWHGGSRPAGGCWRGVMRAVAGAPGVVAAGCAAAGAGLPGTHAAPKVCTCARTRTRMHTYARTQACGQLWPRRMSMEAVCSHAECKSTQVGQPLPCLRRLVAWLVLRVAAGRSAERGTCIRHPCCMSRGAPRLAASGSEAAALRCSSSSS